MDDEVGAAFGGNEVFVLVPGIVQEIAQVPFAVFFTFFVVDPLQQTDQVVFEQIDLFSTGFEQAIGAVQGLFETYRLQLHGAIKN